VLVGVVGLGVDTIRGYLVQSRLSAALDAAGLAGARVMFSPTRDADIQMYFAANFPPGFMGATVTGPTISVNADNSVLSLSAQASIGTSFMRVLGFENLNVASASQITRRTSVLEVVLAVDMSGSMTSSVSGGGTRIQAARNAALSLTSILFGASSVNANLQIGLVPWNGKVNVTRNGTVFNSALTTNQAVPNFTNPITGASQSLVYYANNSPAPLLSAPPANWRGCVFQRFTNDAINTNDADLVLGPATAGTASWPGWEVILTSQDGLSASSTPVSANGEPISGSAKCDLKVSNNECTPCLTHGITDLTSTRATIDGAINQLVSPTGYTNAVQGMLWAWEVLMPNAPFTNAFAVIPPNVTRKRAIILLTDGEMTGMSGDGYKAAFGLDTAAQGNLTNNMMHQRLNDLATAIKAQGIEIYTVQFANTSGSLQALMKAVSTGPDSPFYSTASSSAALTQVFNTIANNLADLHISM
jgi:Mg-chelatase subunit ChlD